MTRAAEALGLRYGLSFYDAAYLAVAEAQEAPLVTADKELLKTGINWVIPLESIAD